MQTRIVGALTVALALGAAGCGGGGDRAASAGRPDLTVAAAASLTGAFTRYGGQFGAARARFSFAGSDELAAQIQQGVKPDVFASANTTLPDQLHAKGLVGRPVVFTANRLVIAVPAGSSRVRSVADLARPGVKVAVGSATVPIGAYTRKVLSNLPAGERGRILANVRSDEPDVKGIVAKVTEKAVDAGFVYVTDVRATGGRAKSVTLPDRLQPRVAYAAAVVTGAKHPAQARAFIDGLLHGAGRSDLRTAGFLPPP
jgi:molybdate transport system substrate-binding protein